MALPALSSVPQHHPDCCLGLSTTFISTITHTLPTSGTVLSIGSGTGLFESYLASYLQAQKSPLSVEGVEVSSTVNKYLTEESTWTVGGTWDLCPRAMDAAAWIFVYPREPGLVKRYFDESGDGDGKVQVVIWLGPRADWAVYKGVLRRSRWELQTVEKAGLVPYEMMAVVRKAEA